MAQCRYNHRREANMYPEQSKIAQGVTSPNGASDPSRARWEACLDSYHDLRAVQFPSPEQFAAAAELLWSERLRDLPYDLVGNRTIIVPAESLPFFEGLNFTVTDVLRPAELAPEELAELRQERGPY
jgi:hypothetical protein